MATAQKRIENYWNWNFYREYSGRYLEE